MQIQIRPSRPLPSKHQLGDFTSIESAPSSHRPNRPFLAFEIALIFLNLYKMIKSLIEICEAELFLFDRRQKQNLSRKS